MLSLQAGLTSVAGPNPALGDLQGISKLFVGIVHSYAATTKSWQRPNSFEDS
jgi:hypothetical protein